MSEQQVNKCLNASGDCCLDDCPECRLGSRKRQKIHIVSLDEGPATVKVATRHCLMESFHIEELGDKELGKKTWVKINGKSIPIYTDEGDTPIK